MLMDNAPIDERLVVIEIEQPESTEPDDLDAEPAVTDDDGPRPMQAGVPDADGN